MRALFSLLVVLGVGGGGVAWYVAHGGLATSHLGFRTAAVERGDLRSTISATGTVEPEEVVDVGAQVAGKVNFFGPDPRSESEARYKDKTIDYGSPVHADSVLAQIDDSVYRAQRDQARAALNRAEADLGQFQAKLDQAGQERKRAEELHQMKGDIKGIADTDYDLIVSNHEVAKANMGVGRAAVEQAQAALQLAQTNFDYTIIKSPVEGVIVDRRVNVGQTVVASLNAPSLFLIAKDLRKMQVWASVNEADIGRIYSQKDMPVQFTVDAYPGEPFRGKVEQVRLNATMTQNVVTYTVVVTFDNSDRRLLPYLTANLQFQIESHTGVLLVPNAALRWRPRLEQVAPEIRDEVAPLLAHKRSEAGSGGGRPGGDGAAGEGRSGRQGAGEGRSGQQGAGEGEKAGKPLRSVRSDRGRLWLTDGDYVRPLEVQLGPGDGTNTEVSGPDLKEGMPVVVGELRAEAAAGSEETNPFAPKIFKGRSH